MRALVIALVASCGGSTEPPPPRTVPPAIPATAAVSPGIELPEVGPTGLDRADRLVADVGVSPSALTVKGRVIAALTDGELAAGDVEGGALGTLIPRVRDAARTLPARIALQVDRRVPARTLVRVLGSLQAGGRDDVVILARAGAHQMSAPLATTGPTSSDLVVSITADALTLSSEKLADLEALTLALAESRVQRGDTTTALTVQVDGGVPVQRVVEVIGAVRATRDGAPLYPDVGLRLGVD